MPARRRQIDPTRSAVEAFANDLRTLGVGQASIPHIAEHSPDVSRAALYAALSGRRVPSSKTLSTLLRWWIGPEALHSFNDDEGYWDGTSQWGPDWAWLDLLDRSHPQWASIMDWMHRRASLADEMRPTLTADPVTIPVPPEQQVFIESLRQALQSSGLLDARPPAGYWELRRVESRLEKRLQRYLNGECLPTESSLFMLLDGTVDPREYDNLLHLSDEARAARVRDRRAARHARKRASNEHPRQGGPPERTS